MPRKGFGKKVSTGAKAKPRGRKNKRSAFGRIVSSGARRK